MRPAHVSMCSGAVEQRFIYAHNAAQWIIMQMGPAYGQVARAVSPCKLVACQGAQQQIARLCTICGQDQGAEGWEIL